MLRRLETYLDVLDHALELRGPLCPGVHQVHRPVKVLHVLAVHLHEGRQLLQDVPDARVRFPAAAATTQGVESSQVHCICIALNHSYTVSKGFTGHMIMGPCDCDTPP